MNLNERMDMARMHEAKRAMESRHFRTAMLDLSARLAVIATLALAARAIHDKVTS